MAGKKNALTLQFLGSGNGFSPGRAYSSFLLDQKILFEPSPTSVLAMEQLRIPLEGLSHVFISHFHGDHFFGLPFLFLHHYFLRPRRAPLTLIGPRGLKNRSERLMDLAFPQTRKKYGQKLPLTFIEVVPGKEYVLEGMTVRVYRMAHGDLTALGFSLRYRERRLAYCGDTGPCPGLWKLLQEVEIAVLEMSSLRDDYPFHLNRQDILEIRKKMPSKSRLILTHLPRLSEKEKRELIRTPCGGVELAEDLKRFPSL